MHTILRSITVRGAEATRQTKEVRKRNGRDAAPTVGQRPRERAVRCNKLPSPHRGGDGDGAQREGSGHKAGGRGQGVWPAGQGRSRTMDGQCVGFPFGESHPCTGDAQLVSVTQSLLHNSLAPASYRAYGAGQRCYLTFCRRYALRPIPASATTLTFFVGHMRRIGLRGGTARQYLAAVRRLHLQRGHPLPAGTPPYLGAALRGYELRGWEPTERRRQAITVPLLRQLKNRLGVVLPSAWDQRCVWAACALAFYGGLRSGELLYTGPGRGIRVSDVTVTEVGLRLRIRIQKNRQRGPAVHIDLPTTGTSTCPVRAAQEFWQARSVGTEADSPLFVTESGVLTRRRLNSILQEALGSGFSSHSLRIGLATAAAAAGVSEGVLQGLGRWRSAAYQGYIRGHRRTALEALVAIARSQ